MDGVARCNFDGKPVSPGDQAVLDEFRRFLAWHGQFAEGGSPALIQRHLRGEPGGSSYWEEWYCTVPPLGMSYVVVLQDWAAPRDDGFPVRRIFKVRMQDAAETEAAIAGDRTGPAGSATGSGNTASIAGTGTEAGRTSGDRRPAGHQPPA